MKALFVVLDGMADVSHRGLKWRTPLQAASTPALDLLAEEGCCALMYPVAPGICPSSEVAHKLNTLGSGTMCCILGMTKGEVFAPSLDPPPSFFQSGALG